MKLIIQSPKKALKAFLKQRPNESERDKFKANLIKLLDKISVIEKQPKDVSEEHLKNNLRDFLRDTYYIDSNAINTKDKKDLVIHIGKSTDTDVAVIIEAKRPSNKNEMISADNANKKALHELILYYLNERIQSNNIQLKHLVITNVYEWFIIDANQFDKYIYRNTQIKKLYETKLNDKKDNPWFYEEISKIISKIEDDIHCIYFDIRVYERILRNNITEDDKELVALYKILSPQHLLKVASPNDSNALNERFYKELLHIIGLEEAREGTKNVIRRKKDNKNAASLIELTIEALITEDPFHRIPDIKIYGENKEEQTYNIALELCITWINRILFLKLLEGQLIAYHQGNDDFRFLNSSMINNFGELYILFHKVLTTRKDDRKELAKYNHVPYLNSSLFEISELEDQTIKINSIVRDGQLELINTTVLKEVKKKTDKLPTLNYLFQFLDAYDFASEGTEDWQKDNKQLINASVLGKVFEKINGYKDGSIFTPAFITMYMCRQSIRLAVVEKFNEVLSDKDKKLFDKFDDVKNYTSRHFKTEDVLKANEIINSLHICDPAVGSGHFLVSALNEIIAIKAELGILADDKGNIVSGYEIEIVNDELIITDQQGNPVEYKIHYGKPTSKDIQRLQKILFHEKQTIIENCLFGVDINPKSVLICRLRLWIELLKNAYYKEPDFSELETLPNIDINIKCGNSLISRFSTNFKIDDFTNRKIRENFIKARKTYEVDVYNYKNSLNKHDKTNIRKRMAEFKEFISQLFIADQKEYKEIKELESKHLGEGLRFNYFQTDKEDYSTKTEKLFQELKKKEQNFIENYQKIYKNAFEWRFEFPEVLDDNGNFVGFDIIIGNPPYGVSLKDALRNVIVEKFGKVPDFEIYYFFINLAKGLLKPNGIKTYIIPNTILFNVFAKKYRESLFNNWQIQEILDCTEFNVFEGSATVRCIITQFINKKSDDVIYYRPTANVISFEELISRELNSTTKDILLANNQNWALVFKLGANILEIIAKIKKKANLCYDFDVSQGFIPYRKSDLIKIYGENKAEEIVKNREWHSATKINNEYKQEIWGENLTKYGYTKPNSYVWYGKHLACFVDLKYFNQTRLLVREITNPTIIACMVSEELVNDPQIISIIPKSNKIDIKVLWAILNSKLATFYHFNSSPKATKGAFPKILVEDIKNFPLPNIEKKKQIEIIKIVDKIISLKQQGKDTSDLEQKIDAMVYELYGLTEEEIKIVEGKN